jgi:two-component system, chemotaxis family, chemotaxis protein CheY
MAANILIVDDSLPMRSVIIKNIKASGFGAGNFYQAPDGNEALKVLKSEWVDLVITDYNMPDMNGAELVSEMKKDDELKTIPVIIVTTEGSQKKVQEFMEKGADGYIKKPFTPEMIREKLTQLLGEMHNENNIENGDDGIDF